MLVLVEMYTTAKGFKGVDSWTAACSTEFVVGVRVRVRVRVRVGWMVIITITITIASGEFEFREGFAVWEEV